ncbi:MAG: glycosyltransferase family 2 protein [Gammaproteobacteria bacterium]|nr:glycosyltransferase family 2 protein [Gammaproteobacteria bacterium]
MNPKTTVLPPPLQAASAAPAPPRVSVIVPTHNRLPLLEEALGSIEAQSFIDWEAVVVDDASTPAIDGRSVIARYPRARVHTHHSSQGGAAAKNTGIAMARGEILAFLDDDDLYDPRYLACALDILDRYADIDVLFMGVGWFGKDAQRSERAHGESLARTLARAPPEGVERSLVRWPGPELLPALLLSVPMPFQRPVVRRAALDGIGRYRPDCLLWDCEWALRASLMARCALLHEPLYLQRSDGQGTSSRADREYDHAESAAEMVLNLYRNPPLPVSREIRLVLRQAASRNAEHVAFHLSKHGDLSGALRAWRRAQWIEPTVTRFKVLSALIARIMQRAISRLKTVVTTR